MNRSYVKHILGILLIGFIFSNITFSQSFVATQSTQNLSYDSLLKYVGTYPSRKKESDFFKNKLVINELRKILKQDFKKYLIFLKYAGCGRIVLKDSILVSDNSQQHVGGYNSIIFFDIANRKTYLFWLNSTVYDKNVRIYGDRPIPIPVQKYIQQDMNQGWGHVAKFKVIGDSVFIRLNKE